MAKESLGQTQHVHLPPRVDINLQEEMHAQFQRMDQVLSSVKKLFIMVWVLVSGAFSLGVYATILDIRTRNTEEVTKKNQADLHNYDIWRAGVDANRFDTSDGLRLSQEHTMVERHLSENLIAQDKRLQRVEDTLISVKETLGRIEKKLEP